jgi:hypothetical protein
MAKPQVRPSTAQPHRFLLTVATWMANLRLAIGQIK